MQRTTMTLALTAAVFAAWADSKAFPSVAINGLRPIGADPAIAQSIQEHLESRLTRQGCCQVVSRTDMDMVIKENALQGAGMCADDACLVEAGQVMGLDKVITGTISVVGRTHNLVLKMIDVRTAKIDGAADRAHLGPADQLLDVADGCLNDLMRRVMPSGGKSAGHEKAENDSTGAAAAMIDRRLSPKADTAQMPELSEPVPEPVNRPAAEAAMPPVSKMPGGFSKKVQIGAFSLLGVLAAVFVTSAALK